MPKFATSHNFIILNVQTLPKSIKKFLLFLVKVCDEKKWLRDTSDLREVSMRGTMLLERGRPVMKKVDTKVESHWHVSSRGIAMELKIHCPPVLNQLKKASYSKSSIFTWHTKTLCLIVILFAKLSTKTQQNRAINV